MSNIISADYWRWVARGDLGRIPAVFAPIERFKRSFNPAYRHLAISASTDLVVEGYPRCGNTFAAQAALLLKPGLRVAHRCHSCTQVARAVRSGKPCVVLLREPVACIASAWVHADGNLSFTFLARHYLRFYRSCRKFRDSVIVSDFTTTTGNFGEVAKAINCRWGIGLDTGLCNGADFERDVFAEIDRFYLSSRRADTIHTGRVSRPAPAREVRKSELHAKARSDIPAKLLAACEAEYSSWKRCAEK